MGTWRVGLALVALLVPTTAAGAWYDHGQAEPGPLDADEHMWREATRDERRVYFNSYPTEYPASANPAAPRAGAQGPFSLLNWEATLGIWRDCDGDGYLGHAEGALLAYPAALLDAAGAQACPPEGEHRSADGRVLELRPIGMVDPCEFEPDEVRERDCKRVRAFERNPDVLYVNDTYVWGDRMQHPIDWDCRNVYPFVPGTTANTGRMLRYADCRTDGALVQAVNFVDHDGDLGLRIDDEDRPQHSDSLLNQNLPAHPYRNPYNNQTGLLQRGSHDPAFEAWSCRDGEPAADPAVHDPTASWWDALEMAWDGAVEDCDASTPTHLRPYHALVDAESHFGHYEGGSSHSPALKTRTDLYFLFDDGRAGTPVGPANLPHKTDASALWSFTGGAGWQSMTIYLFTASPISRSTLAVLPPLEWHFYARLNLSAPELEGALLPGGDESFTYGAEACGESGPLSELWWHWNCDPRMWWESWIPEKDPRPRYARGEPIGQDVGAPYHLRDVDCTDHRPAMVEDVPPPELPQPRHC